MSRQHREIPGRLLLLAMVCACGWSAGCGGSEPTPEHLILVTVDTWRSDHAFAERVGTPLTPHLDALAAESVRFSEASSVGDETTPGVTGFLSGLLPGRTGVVVNSNVLPAELPTLATLLQEAGFTTRALVANPVLAPVHGFDNGFDEYRLLQPRDGRVKVRADELTDAALKLLDGWDAQGTEEGGERLFLWVHYLDPHGPYRPPESYRDLFPVTAFGEHREVPLLPRGEQSGRGGVPGYQQAGVERPSRDARDYLARYAAEVRFLDDQLGRLVVGLDERALLDWSVVVLTSDHGEALENDHGFFFSHNNGPTQDQVRVPLLLRCTACPRGEVVDRPVSTVDILPTALDLLGIERTVETDGVHLLDETPRLVVSQGPHEIGVRKGRWKAMWGGGREPALFDLGADPGERRNLAAEEPERMRELARAMREVRGRPAVTRAGVRDQASGRLREALGALGYL